MRHASKPLSKRSRDDVDGSNTKLHLRHVRIGPHEYHVVSPRPGMAVRWATNYYHGTWHIICDTPGWKLLARLLWGLSHEKHTNTVIWIGPDLLQPVPFDQEKSRPVLIVPINITHLSQSDQQALVQRMRKCSRSDCTIRWQTQGLNGERSQAARFVPRRITTNLAGGTITIRADVTALRVGAEWLYYQVHQGITNDKTTYEYLDDINRPNFHNHADIEGEVQYYRDFALISRRSANVRARIVCRKPDIGAEQLREEIYAAAPAPTY